MLVVVEGKNLLERASIERLRDLATCLCRFATPGLIRIARLPRQKQQRRTIKISRNKIAAVMANLQVFAMLNQTAADSGIWRLL